MIEMAWLYCRKQVSGFLKYFSVSFLWGFFKWFFSGTQGCGFAQFPTFGLRAWKQTYDLKFKEVIGGVAL